MLKEKNKAGGLTVAVSILTTKLRQTRQCGRVNKQIDWCNTVESPQIDPRKLVCDKGTKEQGQSFQQMVLEQLEFPVLKKKKKKRKKERKESKCSAYTFTKIGSQT